MRTPKYFILRNEQDAEEFLDFAEKEGDTLAKNYPFPKELSERKVRVLSKFWKKKLKRYLISYENEITKEKKFYTLHPAWVNFTMYYEEK